MRQSTTAGPACPAGDPFFCADDGDDPSVMRASSRNHRRAQFAATIRAVIDVYWAAAVLLLAGAALTRIQRAAVAQPHLHTALQEHIAADPAMNPRGGCRCCATATMWSSSRWHALLLDLKYPQHRCSGARQKSGRDHARHQRIPGLPRPPERLVNECSSPSPRSPDSHAPCTPSRAKHAPSKPAVEGRLDRRRRRQRRRPCDYPCIRLLHRAYCVPGPGLATGSSGGSHYPQLARWLLRVEALPGYQRTLPPGGAGLSRCRSRRFARIMSHKCTRFPGRIVMVGFGSIGQGVLPLILRHIRWLPNAS